MNDNWYFIYVVIIEVNICGYMLFFLWLIIFWNVWIFLLFLSLIYFLKKNVLVFLNKVFIYGYIFDVLDICEILVGEWENVVVYCFFLILRL